MTDTRAAGEVAILGLDPGSQRTGYARAVFRPGRPLDLQLGTWRVPRGLARENALAWLAVTAEEWITAHRPAVAAVESLFHHKNAKSLLVLAEARGVLLAVLGSLGVPVCEYPPATVKKTVCGSGGADKDQVRRGLLLTIPGLRESVIAEHELDATDALALAWTHYLRSRAAAVEERTRRT